LASVRALKLSETTEIKNLFAGLSEQSMTINYLCSQLTSNDLKTWNSSTQFMPSSIQSFVRKSLTASLPTKSNLLKWGKQYRQMHTLHYNTSDWKTCTVKLPGCSGTGAIHLAP
jgi:hypothetical protein